MSGESQKDPPNSIAPATGPHNVQTNGKDAEAAHRTGPNLGANGHDTSNGNGQFTFSDSESAALVVAVLLTKRTLKQAEIRCLLPEWAEIATKTEQGGETGLKEALGQSIARDVDRGKEIAEAINAARPSHDNAISPPSIKQCALALLKLKFRPTIIYPRGFPKPRSKGGGTYTGKEPFGPKWGLKIVNERTIIKDVGYFTAQGFEPGVGICLGPDLAPEGGWLADIEGDGPEAEDSRARLFGGDVLETWGWPSARGFHQLIRVDGERLRPILEKIKRFQVENPSQPGVYHLPQLPGLELRFGGLKPDGVRKQLQSVTSPTPGTDGVPRQWNGVKAVADAPESFYATLEAIANAESVAASNGKPSSNRNPSYATDNKKAKRGSDSSIKVENIASLWLKKALTNAVSRIESTGKGERRDKYRDEAYCLAGYLHYYEKYNVGYSETELAQTLKAARAIDVGPDDPVVVETVDEAIQDGKGSPLNLPDDVHRAAIGETSADGRRASAEASSNGQSENDESDAKTDESVWLANFGAEIVAEIARHEAGTITLEFVIEAIRGDGEMAMVTVPADQFQAMRWVESRLGEGWVVEPGRDTRDMLRAEIAKANFGRTRHEAIYTSLGWIETTDGLLYLHAGGAIGSAGASDAVRVELSAALKDYILPPPPDNAGLRVAIEARLRFLDLGKAKRPGASAVAAILFALPARALLGPLNVTPHFSGTSGTRKTTTALLVQGCFGVVPPAGEERTATTWGATANGLQRLAYDCGDSVLVIDELTGEDAIRKATEVIQTQGNLKARSRMTRELRIAPGLDPRGSVLSTGEGLPSRNSALGRTLNFEFSADTIDLVALTACQKDVESGLHRQATAAFVQWLATGNRLAKVKGELPTWVAEKAKRLGENGGHARSPWAVAQLLYGAKVFLEFAQDVGVVEAESMKAHLNRIESGFLGLMREQKDTHEESRPGARFLELLRGALSSRRYHLGDTDPQSYPGNYSEQCGWTWERRGDNAEWIIPSGSTRVGWIDEKAGHIYLDPTQAKELAKCKGFTSGQPFENPEQLARDLDSEGLLITTSEGGKKRRKQNRRFGEGTKRVLVLRIADVFGEVPTTEPTGKSGNESGNTQDETENVPF